jgi:hypothetical protein
VIVETDSVVAIIGFVLTVGTSPVQALLAPVLSASPG